MFVEINEQNFNEEIKNGLKLVNFHTQWCGYCKKLEPELKQLEKIWIGQVDADKSQNLVSRFKIMGYPTMVLFKNGQEVERIVGYRPKEDILGVIMKHLK